MSLNQRRELFTEAFLVDNRVSNMVQVMGYHPRYLTCFLRFHTYLMFQDGPLALHLRQYIAILVSHAVKSILCLIWCQYQCLPVDNVLIINVLGWMHS